MGKSHTEERKFEKEMFGAMILPVIACGVFFVILTIFFVDFEALKRLWWVFLVVAFVLYLIVQFFVFPLANIINTRNISRCIFDWKRRGYSERERTELLKQLSKVPLKIMITVTLICLVYTLFWVFSINMIVRLDAFSDLKVATFDYIYMMTSAVFVGYVVGLAALLKSEAVTQKYLCDLVEEGINEAAFGPDSVAGISMKYRGLLFLAIPVVAYCLENIIIVEHVFYHFDYREGMSHISIAVLFILNTCVIIACSLLNQRRGRRFSINVISNLVKNINSSKFSYIPTDLNDELSYVTYLVNKSTEMMHNILLKATETGNEITSSVNRLVEISTENAASSVQQTSSVHQIVDAMEFADSLSMDASSKITTVTDSIKDNFENVEQGFDALRNNMNKMEDISGANDDLLKGVKSLAEQVSGIWDIVNIISSVAEQTKIIAFNAELEASSAGEYGKNFHIVANEIRRLAESTSLSTSEIKDRISKIQHSSDELIVVSKNGTEKINEGLRLSGELKNTLESIKDSSSSVQQSISDMSEIIIKQTSAFTQILDTLKQVSQGIEENTNSSHNVRDYAVKVQKMADELYDLKTTAIGFKGGAKNA